MTTSEKFPDSRSRFLGNHGDGEAVAVGLASSVTVSLFCLARSRTRETAGINKPIRTAIIAITTSNSISVKALMRLRSFGKMDAEYVLLDFIVTCVALITQISMELVNNYLCLPAARASEDARSQPTFRIT
jgi:hypothetical protein